MPLISIGNVLNYGTIFKHTLQGIAQETVVGRLSVFKYGDVVKLENTLVLEANAARLAGSIPVIPTNLYNLK